MDEPRPTSGRRPIPALRARAGACAAGVLLLSLALPVHAQEAGPRPDSVPAPPEGGVTPAGAFLRAALVPGWGHAAIGAYHRGAFYFVTEGATAWMLMRTRHRFAEAGERARFREDVVRAALAAEGVTDPAEVRARLDADPTLRDLNGLVEARRQQREDWMAVAIFLVLLSGVDAFVSAHLQNFPAPLELNAQPVGEGRLELSVGVRIPR